jgi:hypothetical protein
MDFSDRTATNLKGLLLLPLQERILAIFVLLWISFQIYLLFVFLHHTVCVFTTTVCHVRI